MNSFEQDVATCRAALLDSYTNLPPLATHVRQNYAENFHNPQRKKECFREAQEFAIQALASVAYQINNLAASVEQLLDYQQQEINELSNLTSYPKQALKIYEEQVSRRAIALLAKPRKMLRKKKIVVINSEANPAPQRQVSAYRKPIDFNALDGVGHGIHTQATEPPRKDVVAETGSVKRPVAVPVKTGMVPIAAPRLPFATSVPKVPTNSSPAAPTTVPLSGKAAPVVPNVPPPPLPPSAEKLARAARQEKYEDVDDDDALLGPSVPITKSVPATKPPSYNPPPPTIAPPPPQIALPPPSVFLPPPSDDLFEAGETSGSTTLPPPEENLYGYVELVSTPTYISKAKALFDYAGVQEDELNFMEDDVIFIIAKNSDGWFEGFLERDNSLHGLFPGNYVEEFGGASNEAEA